MNILDEIIEYKRQKNESRDSEAILYSRVVHEERDDIRSPSFDSNLNVIAEIKRKSPSKGILAEIDRPEQLANAYELGGANIISVLTDEHYFGARPDDLEKVRSNVSIPVLRKDFIIDLGDVFETYLMNADLMLLIVAAFKDIEYLKELYVTAKELGLQVLVETHSEAEVEIAHQIGAEIVGVNVRDLQSFDENHELGKKLMSHIDNSATKVWESSISTLQDAETAKESGANAVLVGQALVQHEDPQDLISQMRKIS